MEGSETPIPTPKDLLKPKKEKKPDKLISAKCLGLDYEEGDYGLVNGVRKGTFEGDKPISLGRQGTFAPRHPDGAYGWASLSSSSKLNLAVEADGARYNVWVDRFFKDNIGRLTQKRRAIISEVMPEEVKLRDVKSRKGKHYFQVDADDLNSWLERYREHPNATFSIWAGFDPSKLDSSKLKG